MKIVLFVAHPRLHDSTGKPISRINNTLLEAAKQQPNVTIVDLSENNDIKEHQKLIEESDRIVFQFPIFWYNMSALAKGWLESILQYGWAYGGQYKLEGKEILCAITTGQVVSNYSKTGPIGATIDELLISMRIISEYCKAKYLPYFHVGGTPHTLSDAELQDSAKKYGQYITSIF